MTSKNLAAILISGVGLLGTVHANGKDDDIHIRSWSGDDSWFTAFLVCHRNYSSEGYDINDGNWCPLGYRYPPCDTWLKARTLIDGQDLFLDCRSVDSTTAFHIDLFAVDKNINSQFLSETNHIQFYLPYVSIIPEQRPAYSWVINLNPAYAHFADGSTTQSGIWVLSATAAVNSANFSVIVPEGDASWALSADKYYYEATYGTLIFTPLPLIPEPRTVLLVLLGAAALCVNRHRFRDI